MFLYTCNKFSQKIQSGLFCPLTYEKKCGIIYIGYAPGSSNGRTTGSGPVNRGSNPCPGSIKHLRVLFFCT